MRTLTALYRLPFLEKFTAHKTAKAEILIGAAGFYKLFLNGRDITKGELAFNTFACSRDLINWTHWNGEPLIKSEYDWENVHAHKPWFVRNKGKNYHFYCAVNDKNERFIALATSE